MNLIEVYHHSSAIVLGSFAICLYYAIRRAEPPPPPSGITVFISGQISQTLACRYARRLGREAVGVIVALSGLELVTPVVVISLCRREEVVRRIWRFTRTGSGINGQEAFLGKSICNQNRLCAKNYVRQNLLMKSLCLRIDPLSW